MSEVSDKIISKYRHIFEQCDNLISLADKCFKEYTSKQKNNRQSLYEDLVLKFACRSFKSFQAICLLAREGFAQDAITLVRALFENTANLNWIKAEPEKRSLMWQKDYYERGIQWATEVLKHNDYWNVENKTEQTKNKLEKEFADFKVKNHSITDKIPNLYERCVECGMSYLYTQIYRPYSHIDHGGMGALNLYFEYGEKSTRLDCTPSPMNVDQPLFYAFKCFAIILPIFSDNFNLLDENDRKKLQDIFEYKVQQ